MCLHPAAAALLGEKEVQSAALCFILQPTPTFLCSSHHPWSNNTVQCLSCSLYTRLAKVIQYIQWVIQSSVIQGSNIYSGPECCKEGTVLKVLGVRPCSTSFPESGCWVMTKTKQIITSYWSLDLTSSFYWTGWMWQACWMIWDGFRDIKRVLELIFITFMLPLKLIYAGHKEDTNPLLQNSRD